MTGASAKIIMLRLAESPPTYTHSPALDQSDHVEFLWFGKHHYLAPIYSCQLIMEKSSNVGR